VRVVVDAEDVGVGGVGRRPGQVAVVEAVAAQVPGQRVTVVDRAAEQVLDQEPTGPEQLDLLGEGLRRPRVPEAGLDVDDAGRTAGHLQERLLGGDHTPDDRPDQLDVTVVTGQPRRPDALLPAVHGGDLGLVQRCPGGEPALVAVGQGGRVLGQAGREVGVEEGVVQPRRGAVVDQVDDGLQVQLVQPVYHPVRPVPDEPPGRRVQPVPRESVADRARPGPGGQAEVLGPEPVVLGQFVLIQRPVTGNGVGDEGVLDPHREPEVALHPGSLPGPLAA
jgi:hypothetical protein